MDKSALFNLSYGVYVVSSTDGERHVGCVVNSIFQVSASPASIAISINKDNYTNPCIQKSKEFAVSILTENADPSIIGTFGFKTSKDTNKFENMEYIKSPNNIPILIAGACAYIECKVIKTVDCFTHTIIIAEITDAKKLNSDPPMTYSYYHKVVKGKAPKNAPTYVEEKIEDKKYVCSICGYVYEGSNEEFEALPDSYICPICSAPKSVFELK